MSDSEIKIRELTANVNALVRELKDFKTEMRDRDNQRAAEIRNLDNQVRNLDNKRTAEMRELDNKRTAEMRDRDNQWAADMREIRSSIQNMQSSGRNLNIVTILGVAAIVIAVLLK